MLWVIVFSALAFAALVAVGYFAFGVYRAGMDLSRQLGGTAKLLGEQAKPLQDALDQLGAGQSRSRPPLTK